MKRLTMTLLIAGVFAALIARADDAPAKAAYSVIVQESAALPITTFNLTFKLGSADDPHGLEGIAALTAELMREGGVGSLKVSGRKLRGRDRAELEEFLFPLAAEVGLSIEKEQISFRSTATAENARTVLEVLAQVVLSPAFESKEFERLKSETLDALTKALPREDQEELGKAALDQAIYGKQHPYGHVDAGTVESLRKIQLSDVKEFYRTHFTQSRLIVGAAGVISPEVRSLLETGFMGLPAGGMTSTIPAVAEKAELHLTLVKGDFDAVGEHLGQPLWLNRADPDFSGMFLASWAFGKHRSFVGRLMQVVREIRGLNYGTYAYVEDFPEGGQREAPPVGAARTRQAFTVWARPTTPPNACFLLRQVYREVTNLAAKGLTAKEFKLTQSHLVGAAPLLATGIQRRLGYAIDSRFYGIEGDYLLGLQSAAKKLTLARVNAELRKNLHPQHLDIVVVTSDPEGFTKQLQSPRCPISYASGVKKSADILVEDRKIEVFAVPVDPKNIRTVSAESIFQE